MAFTQAGLVMLCQFPQHGFDLFLGAAIQHAVGLLPRFTQAQDALAGVLAGILPYGSIPDF